MKVLKESSDYLEKKMDSTKKEIEDIQDKIKNNNEKKKIINQQLYNADLQLQTAREKMDSKRNSFAISSIFALILLAIGFSTANIILIISLSFIALIVVLFFTKGYLEVKTEYDSRNLDRIAIQKRLDEHNKIVDQYILSLETKSRKCEDYNKGLLGEKSVTEVLKSLGPDSYVINDVMLHRPFGNIDHILVSRYGIFVIETKNWGGKVVCDGDNWCKHYEGDNKSLNYEQESISKRVKGNAIKLRQLIGSKVFNNLMDVWVGGIVVFTNPEVKLELNNPMVAVLRINELCDYIKTQRSETKFSSRDLESIANYILREVKG